VPETEALLPRFRAAHTQVLGVSVDSVYSHANWAASMGGISFPLLSDFQPRGALAEALGVFLAGAGITVRNSIILVDFVELRRAQGLSLRDAVVDAGAVRFRPMVLTAAAVAVGASVILFDPIFQGLAIALIGGEVAATVLSRMAVPVLYYLLHRHKEVSS